jgi:hypothetical protein
VAISALLWRGLTSPVRRRVRKDSLNYEGMTAPGHFPDPGMRNLGVRFAPMNRHRHIEPSHV